MDEGGAKSWDLITTLTLTPFTYNNRGLSEMLEQRSELRPDASTNDAITYWHLLSQWSSGLGSRKYLRSCRLPTPRNLYPTEMTAVLDEKIVQGWRDGIPDEAVVATWRTSATPAVFLGSDMSSLYLRSGASKWMARMFDATFWGH